MTCPRCQIDFNSRHWGECPHCGALNDSSPEIEGVIKTSTILISTDDGGVFGSIEEVPEPFVSFLSDSDDGLTIEGGRAIPLGSPVKVVQNDGLWLGEVIESHLGGATRIKVFHTLDNLAELERLADHFLGRYAMLTPECPDTR